MAERGNLEWVAATLGQMQREMRSANDKRLDAFTTLLSSIETGMADLLENIERGGGSAAIEAMAKALGSIKMPEVTVNVNPTPIEVKVPEQTPPMVTVQVNPTPVTMECVMPEMPAPTVNVTTPDQKGATWKVTMPTQYGDRVMTIERTN
jgi:hypothetical protein